MSASGGRSAGVAVGEVRGSRRAGSAVDLMGALFPAARGVKCQGAELAGGDARQRALDSRETAEVFKS